MIILGLGGILSDPACAVLKDGELVAAIEQEKVARRPPSGSLPDEAIALALQLAKATPADVNCVALVRPFRLCQRSWCILPPGDAMEAEIRIICVAITGLVALAAVSAQAQDQKPNILLIVGDDVGWGDLGPYGGGEGRGMPTPNIDKMAQAGMTFFSF